jgi:hypothetical protein
MWRVDRNGSDQDLPTLSQRIVTTPELQTYKETRLSKLGGDGFCRGV